MKTEEQIKEEITKHKKRLKEIWHLKDEKSIKDKYLHECIIEGLEWVIDKKIRRTSNAKRTRKTNIRIAKIKRCK